MHHSNPAAFGPHRTSRASDEPSVLGTRWDTIDPHLRAGIVRKILRARLKRAEHFKDGLFADPAWDMLLALYACSLGQTRSTVSRLVQASAVPSTTGLRWMNALLADGLAERRDDPHDRRRTFIELSDKGRAAMDNYFSDLPSFLYSL